MAELLSEVEGEPAAYPTMPSGLSATTVSAIDSDAIWQRLESWISYRFSIRQVEWIVRGPGWFAMPLKPAALGDTEIWDGGAWVPVTLDEAPIGYVLNDRFYKIKASVGQTTVPASVNEAFRRLAEYLADQSDIGRVATSASHSLGDAISWEATRPAAWQAKAIHYSGAADLLRRYRC